ncbi:hypothetical protein LX36DRAFT_265994 [Colletotrichum falcatum]|nr:hypothetical protein LX36DRAFT_265994 [Colletotrichum falcatum]
MSVHQPADPHSWGSRLGLAWTRQYPVGPAYARGGGRGVFRYVVYSSPARLSAGILLQQTGKVSGAQSAQAPDPTGVVAQHAQHACGPFNLFPPTSPPWPHAFSPLIVQSSIQYARKREVTCMACRCRQLEVGRVGAFDTACSSGPPHDSRRLYRSWTSAAGFAKHSSGEVICRHTMNNRQHEKKNRPRSCRDTKMICPGGEGGWGGRDR